MKKISILLSLILLLLSCNADILMNNGEIIDSGNGSKNDSADDSLNGGSSFSGEAPNGVNVTKSYYPDKIVVRWNSVKGADYYNLEKATHSTVSPADDVEWKTILESVKSTSYEDLSEDLEPGVYYSYRITAYTYSGDIGATSSYDTGTILASPTTLEASKGESTTQINILWEQMPNVEEYKIYKSEISSVSGSKSEFIDSVSANGSNIKNAYSYTVDTSEKGKELYFAIQGIGPTGENAPISLPRVGYTFVEGAPLPPDCSFITQGDSTESITIKFKSTSDNATYVINRSAKGSAETEVYNSEFDGELDKDENGYLIFVDDEVRHSTEYTYSITAKNDLGISKATTVKGFLLSPVSNVKLVPTEKDGKIGYSVNFELPVGSELLEGNNRYSYEITETTKGNVINGPIRYSEEEIEGVFFEVDENVAKENELKEVRYIEITTVNSENQRSDSAKSNSISDLSPQMGEITVSQNKKPSKKDKSNENGVYPVTVSWKALPDVGGYKIVITDSDGVRVKEAYSDTNSYVDEYENSKPFMRYDYYVYAVDAFGRYYEDSSGLGAGGSTGVGGYGAISPEVYIRIFESLSLKPWERPAYLTEEHKQYWAKSRIGELVGYGNSSDLNTQMKALDDADDKDHYHDESKITYSASMEGIGGQIYFTYEKFGEHEEWQVTGNYEMHVNASGTGSAASNTNGFKVEGMYPGKISLSSISVVGKTFVGSYTGEMIYSNEESNQIKVEVPKS